MLDVIRQNPDWYPKDAESLYLARLDEHIQKVRSDWKNIGWRHMLLYNDVELTTDGLRLFVPSDMAPELDTYVWVKCPSCESIKLDQCDLCRRPKKRAKR